jgi:hypothetical protein
MWCGRELFADDGRRSSRRFEIARIDFPGETHVPFLLWGRMRCAVNCEVCREALSARLDGEAEPAAPAAVDEHLGRCPACRRWQTEAMTLTRALRVRQVVDTPDLVATVLRVAPVVSAGSRDRAGKAWR